MAVKTRSVHRCTECGAESLKWAGRCETCGEWNTLAEELDVPSPASVLSQPPTPPVPITAVRSSGGRPVPTGLADHLEAMEAELLDHMAKEETVLFPLLRQDRHSGVGVPIQVMRDEHTSHGAQLERLMALTNDASPPPGACNTWRALYAGIGQFSDDLISHIHTENNLLFPAFE